MATQLDLKTLIDSSVMATKPRFTDISPIKLQHMLRQSSGNRQLEVRDIRGSSAKTGASSGILLFSAGHDGNWAPYVLRYAPMLNAERIFVDYNIPGQFRLQCKLSAAGLPVPIGRWVDADGALLGLPGFVMDAVEGEVTHGSAFTGGLFAEADDQRLTRLFDEVLRTQARIHAVDWQALGLLNDVCNEGGRTPLEGYIRHFWRTAEWVEPVQLERLRAVRDWLVRNQPSYPSDDYTLVHGDPGLGNYMFRNDKVVAILDWELAGVVHPSYDLAMNCSLANFFRAAASPDIAARIPTDEWWLAQYKSATGRTVSDFDYFRKLATLPSLIVCLSMNRGMPAEMRKPHLEMMEVMWAVAEQP